jgi:ferrochelatase
MKIAVLLFNLGGPETLADVKPFLYRLFSDPEIIPITWTPLRKFVAYAIAATRKKKSQSYYKKIGGGSPLRRLTEEQAAALEAELKSRNRDARTYVGMVTSPPFLEDAINRIAQAGPDVVVILPLFPQYSYTTTRGALKTLREIIDSRPAVKRLDVRWIESWGDHPSYIDAFAKAIERELARYPTPAHVHILFSAHSIPEKKVQEGDPYLDQTRTSVERIMDRLGRENPYQLSFQSKIGPVKWLSPMTNDVIVDLGRKGTRDVLVVPISFVSEHIETLYELDILYADVARNAGVSNFRRVPALNSDAPFIRALADIVESALP